MEVICTSIILALTFSATSSSISTACGVRKSLSRIVGGRDTGGYHYPWFALLVLKENEDYPVCAGSLITTRHILTAAHCFNIKPSTPKEQLFTVLMGVYDRCNHNEPKRQPFAVYHVDVHEEYIPGEKFHDIALMTLAKPAEFTSICLPMGVRDASEPALLIGFGVTEEGGRRAPCRMREAYITKFSKEDCKTSELPEEDITESSVICAGKIGGGVDSCQGDSGGPLQTINADGKFVIQGIVSYGYGCANPGLPGLYTNVANYLSWIDKKISYSKSSCLDGNNKSQSAIEKRREFLSTHVNFPTNPPQIIRFPPVPTYTTIPSTSTVKFPNNRK